MVLTAQTKWSWRTRFALWLASSRFHPRGDADTGRTTEPVAPEKGDLAVLVDFSGLVLISCSNVNRLLVVGYVDSSIIHLLRLLHLLRLSDILLEEEEKQTWP